MIIMKKIIRIVGYLLIVVIISTNTIVKAKETNNEPKKIYAYSALLMDKKTGRVLWEKKGLEKRAMASTTKIMTCIMALELCELDEIVEVSKNASKAPRVKLYIKPGEHYYLEDLLHALMLVSSNDVAVAIAEHVAGSTEEFCKIMTNKAKEIGAINTCYKTPNGLDAEGHYTTAYDLALITRYALDNEKFLKIINTPEKSFTEIDSGKQFSVNNKNAFLNMYDGANGVKTGYTSQAGYCFVGSVKHEELELISVVLASGWVNNKTYKWSDTKKIMNYGFDNFETKMVLTKDKHICQIDVDKGINKNIDVLTSRDVEITLSKNETIDILYNVEPNLIAPIEIGQNVGEAEIYIDGKYYDSIPLISNTRVKKITYRYILHKVLDEFLLFSD